jgi:hypothetical protein
MAISCSHELPEIFHESFYCYLQHGFTIFTATCNIDLLLKMNSKRFAVCYRLISGDCTHGTPGDGGWVPGGGGATRTSSWRPALVKTGKFVRAEQLHTRRQEIRMISKHNLSLASVPLLKSTSITTASTHTYDLIRIQTTTVTSQNVGASLLSSGTEVHQPVVIRRLYFLLNITLWLLNTSTNLFLHHFCMFFQDC